MRQPGGRYVTSRFLLCALFSLFLLVILISESAFAQIVPEHSTMPARPVEDSIAFSTRIASVTSLIAVDHQYDDGEAIDLTWVPSLDDQLVNSRVLGYVVYKSVDSGVPSKIAELLPRANSFRDETVTLGHIYTYSITTRAENSTSTSISTAPISPEREWINFDLTWLFVMAVVIGGAIVLFIETARRGKKLFVRKIAGLEAIDNAIGRATEMGRPILYIPGIEDMNEVETIASVTILGRVARIVADYDTKLNVPVSRSLVMTAARETIKAAYVEAGRQDAYNDDMVRYITDEQFGYVAAVDGIMVREKPATVFLLGAFFGESLILAEMGNQVGAIQIAGTARPPQIPFFVAACDYTLIGEELFAASAYLSGEPKQLGSLKGQDIGKGIAMAAIFIGALAATIAAISGNSTIDAFHAYISNIFSGN